MLMNFFMLRELDRIEKVCISYIQIAVPVHLFSIEIKILQVKQV